tara:strand:+ start:752 stop:1150 length:399 start_codon:yes stop_codon:yes gene_type:complete
MIRLVSKQGQMSIRVFTPVHVVTDKGSGVHDRVVMHVVIPSPKRPILDRMGVPVEAPANEGGGGFEPIKPKEFWHTRAIKELLKAYPKRLVAIMMYSSTRSIDNWVSGKRISSAKSARLAHVVRETKTEVPK